MFDRRQDFCLHFIDVVTINGCVKQAVIATTVTLLSINHILLRKIHCKKQQNEANYQAGRQAMNAKYLTLIDILDLR